MTKEIALGDQVFDAIEYSSRANAVLGLRDVGKTYLSQVIAEQQMDLGIPIVVLDGIGRWKFMRAPNQHRATGAKGYEIVVAGGQDGDLPLSPENAADLMRAAMQNGISIVFDLHGVQHKADWRKIVRAVCTVLMNENERHGLRHLWLEEAHEYVPQRVRDGMTYDAVERVVKMGGNVGVGVTMIAHRAADTNKSALELCENLILMAQTGSKAIEGLEKWFERGGVEPPGEIVKTLSKLPTGDAWLWLRGAQPVRIHAQPKRSFDANRREMALPGDRELGPSARRVDISEFIARMKAALEGRPVTEKKPSAATTSKPSKSLEEDQVDKATADRLIAENAELRGTNDKLQDEVRRLMRIVGEPAGAPPELGRVPAPYPIDETRVGPHDPSIPTLYIGDPMLQAITDEVIKRLGDRAPALIKIAATKPEIDVAVKRQIVEMDGSTPKGRFIRLIAEGFFDEGTTNGAIRTRLKSTGNDVSNPSISKFCDELTVMGLLTRSGTTYTAVPGMKVNIREA